MITQPHTPDEQVKDFIPETKQVKLKNGLLITVSTPTLGWWFDFFFPKMQEVQWSQIDEKTKQELIREVQKGKINAATLKKFNQSSLPILDTMLEIVVHYSGREADWCKKNMDLSDFLAVVNAFLQVLDAERVIDFFGQIAKQVPVGLLATIGGV
jgi:hypothetical protein